MAKKVLPGNINLDGPLFTETIGIDAFDAAIQSQGIEFVHYKAQRCPVGLIDSTDTRHPLEHHENCSNGLIYTKAGNLTCLMVGNNHNLVMLDPGILDGSTIQITAPRFYDQDINSSLPKKTIHLAPLDRLYLKDETITVPHWELVEAHVTGIDRLSFLAIEVTDLIDSQGVRYEQNADFTVENGYIVWGKGRRPQIDPNTGKGLVCSVRYLYRPHWIVKTLLHEVRVAQTLNPITGERETTLMPQNLLLQREYIFLNEQNNSLAPSSPRHGRLPSDGGFGVK